MYSINLNSKVSKLGANGIIEIIQRNQDPNKTNNGRDNNLPKGNNNNAKSNL